MRAGTAAPFAGVPQGRKADIFIVGVGHAGGREVVAFTGLALGRSLLITTKREGKRGFHSSGRRPGMDVQVSEQNLDLYVEAASDE